MCKYTHFIFLCGASKLKVTEPCEYAHTNYHGITYCRNDAQAHVTDRKYRDNAYTYGPGVCSNINCREAFGMLPRELSSKNQASDMVEDDSEFDMSPEACLERENRWHHLLSTDQQWEFIDNNAAVPIEAMSAYARANIYMAHLPPNDWAPHFDAASGPDANPDEVTWRELNPRWMSQCALRSATILHLLPAWVVDTNQPDPYRQSTHRKGKKKKKIPAPILTTTPHMPLVGPFKVGDHTCKPNVGFCKTCGQYRGKECRRKRFRFHKLDYAKARQAFENEEPATQKVMMEEGWSMVPFHGNNDHRDALRELQQPPPGQETVVGGEMVQIGFEVQQASMGDGSIPNFMPENTDFDMFMSSRSSSDARQTIPFLQDLTMEQYDRELAALMPDYPTTPSTAGILDAPGTLDVDRFNREIQAFLQESNTGTISSCQGMPNIPSFNGSHLADRH